MSQEIKILFERVKGWEHLSTQSREIFVKHSGSLIQLGETLRVRDEERVSRNKSPKSPAPI